MKFRIDVYIGTPQIPAVHPRPGNELRDRHDVVLQLRPFDNVPIAPHCLQAAGGVRILCCMVLVSELLFIQMNYMSYVYSVLWVLILLFVRETKGRTLEELDQVFSLPMRDHAAYGLRQVSYGIRKFLLRQDVRAEKLYEGDDESAEGAEDHGRGNLVRREKAEAVKA